ncbi:MAG: tetratricopeptide repeat protein, partial [Vulcanimicrobiaceae bacterium]
WEIFDTTLREDAYDALGVEIGNVRAAIAWARDSGDLDRGAAVVAYVGARALQNFGSVAEWNAQLTYFIDALPGDRTAMRAKLYDIASYLAGASGRMLDAFEYAERSVACARSSGDARALADALCSLAVALRRTRRFPEAEAPLREAEALGGPDFSPRSYVVHWTSRAMLASAAGDADESIRGYERIIAKHRALGAPMRNSSVVSNVAETEHQRGNTERAIAVAREGLATGTSRLRSAGLLANLAGYLLAVDDLAAARESAEKSIALYETNDPDSVMRAVAIEHLALAVALEGDLARAARLLGHTSQRFAEAGFEREYTETVTCDRLRALLAGGLTPEELARYEAEGRDYTPSRAREEATLRASVGRPAQTGLAS